ncbi:hypothetical protein KDI_51230 [Dictyobacter arantiisoli]|uniref:Uncharacterized protein n=1 Tax=Dictyobacter arantiisoli TaxID=2014874 RepID=A0A5A5TKI2_9CHLR|nr:hypothetical protein KDI_51230 [Dictyobacter arantiisoli]
MFAQTTSLHHFLERKVERHFHLGITYHRGIMHYLECSRSRVCRVCSYRNVLQKDNEEVNSATSLWYYKVDAFFSKEGTKK